MTNYLSWPKLTFIFTSSYILTAYIILEKLHNLSDQHVQHYFGNKSLLVIAHPDDETMFFGPTIINLLNANKSLVILCLSTGNEDNNVEEGRKQRLEELSKVVISLGPSVKLNVIKDEQLKDSMSVQWNTKRISKYIEEAIITQQSHEPISTLITFDSYGISGHLNHQSIYKAFRYMINNNKLKNRLIDAMTLYSQPIWRKYTSFLDSIPTYLMTMSKNHSFNESKKTFTLALNFPKYFRLKEILQIHESQMVWFRKLYMLFSRYMFLNDLSLLT